MTRQPRRHASTDRNRKKIWRHLGRIEDELAFLQAEMTRLSVHIVYAIRKADKLRNRLRSELPRR